MPCPTIGPELFWSGPNIFGLDQNYLDMVQKAKFSEKLFLVQFQIISTRKNILFQV